MSETTTIDVKRMGALLGLALAALLVASFLLAARPTHASTTLTVDTEQDSGDANPGDGVCNANLNPGGKQLCPLSAAIQEANAVPGADVINFNVNNPEGVGVIQPTSQLPSITDRVTIDGYSQPGSKPNTLAQGTNADLRVWLFGNNAGSGAPGLRIDPGGSGSVIRGLVIDSFRGDGVVIEPGSTQNRIEGNFIGADPGGTLDQGNGAAGVDVFSSSFNTIGGSSPDKRNLISGNGSQGVTIGVATVGFAGLTASSDNRVQGNLVGTQKDGISALGNGSIGMFVANSSNNTVSSNTIAFNGTDGMGLVSAGGTSTGNLLAGNSIFSNVDQGIDLGDDGVTKNDTGDGDVGPNDLQNFPVLSSAKTTKKGTTITGKLNSTPNKSFLVQFFSNASGDEGQKFIGQVGVTTDASGNATFTFKPTQKVSKGKITATAIDSASKNTSEFSAAKKVVRKR